MCYSLWYNAPVAMPADSLEAEFLCFQAKGWQHRGCFLCTTGCNTQPSAPEDGRNYRPKHVELIGIINKPLLLYLVGCLYYLLSIDVNLYP